MSELGLHQIGHISFGHEYRHSPVSQMAYELENYFSRYEYYLDVISHKKLRMGIGNRYRMRDPITWKVVGVPLHKNVDIIGYGTVNGNDFRPYYKGDCEVFVDDISVFKGDLKSSAKIMHEKSREIALESRQMMVESVKPSNIVEIRQILGDSGDPTMDQLVSEKPSQKEEIIHVMRALSVCVRDDSLCQITVNTYRYEIRLRNPILIDGKTINKTLIMEKGMYSTALSSTALYSTVHDYRVSTSYGDNISEVLTDVDPTTSLADAINRMMLEIKGRGFTLNFVVA